MSEGAQAIKTWTLTPLGATTLVTRRADGREITGAGIDRTTKVIELEPMLDLLEAATKVRIGLARSYGERLENDPAVTLLRAHGRPV